MATGGADTTERDATEILQAVTKNAQAANSDPNCGSTETEAIVLAEIRKLRVKGKRADSESVAASIQKKHGLARSATILQVKYLIACGKLVLAYHGGKESLRIPKDPVAESKTLEACKPDSQGCDVSSDESDTSDEPDERGNLGSFGFGFDPRWPHPSEGYSSTTPNEIIGELARSLRSTNEMLCHEREFSRKLLMENLDLKLRIKDLEHDSSQPVNNCPLGGNSKKKTKHIEIVSDEDNSDTESVIENDNQNNKGSWKQVATRRRASDNRSGKRNNQQHPTKRNEIKSNNKPNNKNKKIKMVVIGDSQLRNLDGSKLTNEHHTVEVIPDPGARIAKMKGKQIDSDADVILIHAGTNNVKSTEPEALADEVLETMKHIQDKYKKAQLVFSSIFRRKDNHQLNAKVLKTNEILKETLLLNGFDYVDNDNILFSNLAKDGLHINEGGMRKFASNVSRYIRYC